MCTAKAVKLSYNLLTAHSVAALRLVFLAERRGGSEATMSFDLCALSSALAYRRSRGEKSAISCVYLLQQNLKELSVHYLSCGFTQDLLEV